MTLRRLIIKSRITETSRDYNFRTFYFCFRATAPRDAMDEVTLTKVVPRVREPSPNKFKLLIEGDLILT